MTERNEEFRAAGHDLVDWIADYLDGIESFPVQPVIEPGTVRANLPPGPPANPEPWPAILDDLERVILPGVTHWQSPNFFGYFPANAS